MKIEISTEAAAAAEISLLEQQNATLRKSLAQHIVVVNDLQLENETLREQLASKEA